MNEKAIVHVIDDDESVRSALHWLLRTVDLEARSYESVRHFLDARVHDGPGCIVLDVRLPGISGLDFQSQLAKLGVHLPVVVMTGHGDIAMCVSAMKAGAVDFLPKPFRDQDMIDAIWTAITQDLHQRAAADNVAVIRRHFGTLSPREQQVMMLVTAGTGDLAGSGFGVSQ
jgi:FixJ family two-component response regulator